jgi:hypothetical protein
LLRRGESAPEREERKGKGAYELPSALDFDWPSSLRLTRTVLDSVPPPTVEEDSSFAMLTVPAALAATPLTESTLDWGASIASGISAEGDEGEQGGVGSVSLAGELAGDEGGKVDDMGVEGEETERVVDVEAEWGEEETVDADCPFSVECDSVLTL